MKLLFDESLSPRLALLLRDLFPGSESALRNGLARAGDRRILDHRLTAELEAEAPRKSPGNLTHIPNPASREPRRTRGSLDAVPKSIGEASAASRPPRNFLAIRRSRINPRAVATSVHTNIKYFSIPVTHSAQITYYPNTHPPSP